MFTIEIMGFKFISNRCRIAMQTYWRASSHFFPPALAVEGIKSVRSVCVCVSVCLSVIQRSHRWTVWRTDLKFGRRDDLYNRSDEFEGQGHRSKVKVGTLKKREFSTFWWCDLCKIVHIHLPWHFRPFNVTAWRHDIIYWHLGKNIDKEGTSREGASTLRRFHFCVKIYHVELLLIS